MIHDIPLYICIFVIFRFLFEKKKKSQFLCSKTRSTTKLNATSNGKMNKYLNRKTKTNHQLRPFWFKSTTYFSQYFQI